MTQQQADDVTEAQEALKMLGKGYEPSVEIAKPQIVIERHGKEFKEVERAAFVKISTSFKGELVNISDAALKVWIFIALSVNRSNGKANPGLRTIARAMKKGVNTVRECLKELEELGLMTVDRQSKKYNIYEPTAYVSANRAEPVTVSEPDTAIKTVSENGGSVSENLQSVSASQTLNQRNQNKPEIDTFLEFEKLKAEHRGENEPEATRLFEKALGFSKPLPWWQGKDWTTFSEWVCQIHAENPMAFGEYQIWRGTPFTKGGISNNHLRRFVKEFYDSWDMFQMSKPPEHKTDETRPEYQPYVVQEEEGLIKGNPAVRR